MSSRTTRQRDRARINWIVEPPRNEAEFDAAYEILCDVFNMPPDMKEQARKRLELTDWVIVREESGRLAGGLVIIKCGQFFGGRRIPTGAISLVGITPAARGTGAGSALMRQLMRMLHERGVPLSTLYPATQPIYRSAGYEQAGTWPKTTIRLKELRARDDSGLSLRAIESEADHQTVEALYRADAARHNGTLDRDAYLWARVRQPLFAPNEGYLVERDGRAEGFIHYRKTGEGSPGYGLMATDILAATHDASRRLISFLAQHQSMCGEMIITRGTNDPLISLLREQSYTMAIQGIWMLRIVDVRKGLEQRGYPPGLSGEVHLEIEDDVVPQNEGRWILRVEDGEARVEPGGRGELRMHVRGLASLYSGYRSAEQTMVMGLAEGDAEAARAATAVFTGPSPWMVEIF